MPRAKQKPFIVSRVDGIDYMIPPCVFVHGLIVIDGSPQGNSRPIYAQLSIEEAEQLERRLHAAIQKARGL